MKQHVEESTWRLWGEDASVDGAIYTVYLKKVRYHTPPHRLLDSDEKISHLEWETVKVRFIKGGTLERLVEHLSTENGELESSYSHVFFSTYRTFAEPAEVLTFLLNRYQELIRKGNGADGYWEQQRRNIRQALHVWLDIYPEDWSETCLLQLLRFCQQYLSHPEFVNKVQEKLKHFRREEEFKGSTDRLGLREIRCVSPITPGHCHITHIPEDLFAQQLTRMDAELFKRVIPYQCLGSVWSRREKRGGECAATVAATVEQFNAVSFRVISTILMDLDLKPQQRARILVKWIDIAQVLRCLKNFSSLKAIISGLQSNPIYRLKRLWDAIPKEKMEVFEELARIFSEENNQLTQRELLQREGTAKFADTVGENDKQLQRVLQKHAQNTTTISHGTIPYLGTFLTDLTMIDTAIPDYLPSTDRYINFDKKRKEFELLAQIRLFQGVANSYHIVPDPAFERWFDSILVLDDKDSYELSCVIEPPTSTPQSTNSSVSKQKKRSGLGHRKTDSIASTASSSSSSQFYLELGSDSIPSSPVDGVSLERKMSTSSSSGSLPSLPSLDVSMGSNTTNTASQSSNSKSQQNGLGTTPADPYSGEDVCIIKVSLESNATEIEGQNMYKGIVLKNCDHTRAVIKSAIDKHGIEGSPDLYTLSQVLTDREMVFPANANVYYALNPAHGRNFILRKKNEDHDSQSLVVNKLGDSSQNTISKARKKLLPSLGVS